MNSNWQPAMKSAISEVLETMFFVLIDFVAQRSTSPVYRYGSKIQLMNDLGRVEVCFRVTESFARMVTATFLSKQEDEVIPEEIEDVMKELANMVGGNYMSRIQNEGWNLGIPQFEQCEEELEGLPSGMPLSYCGENAGVVDFLSFPSSRM